MSSPRAQRWQPGAERMRLLESDLVMLDTDLGAVVIAVLACDQVGAFLYFRDGAASLALNVLQNANYPALRRLQEEHQL